MHQKLTHYCKSQPLWKPTWRFLKKLGIKPPYDPAIPLLGVYSKEIKILKGACTPIFIAAPFTIARTWKQPRCPSADEWIKKLWSLYTMEYYLAIKRDAFESVQLYANKKKKTLIILKPSFYIPILYYSVP